MGPGVGCRLAAAALVLCLGCGARSGLDIDDVDVEPATHAEPRCEPASPEPFARDLGDHRDQVVASIAVDRSGHPILAGAFTGTLDLGGTTLTAPDPGNGPLFDLHAMPLSGSLFFARLVPSGSGCAPLARAFAPMDAAATAVHVALGPEDDLVLAASYFGAIDFGGGPVGSLGSPSATITLYGPEGKHRVSRELVATTSLVIARPAIDAQGNVFVAGHFSGELTLDGKPFAASAPKLFDAFVVKLHPDGTLEWAKHLLLSSKSWAQPRAFVAAWPGGDVAVSGHFYSSEGGAIDLGGGPITGLPYKPTFVTSFDAAGEHRWQSLLDLGVVDSQVSPSGELWLLGGWSEKGFKIHRFDSTGAKTGTWFLDEAGGTARIAAGAGGEVLIGVAANATVTPGLRAHKLGPAGEVLWSRELSTPELGSILPAFDPWGTPYVAGTFRGFVDFGTGELTSEGSLDGYVAALPP